ncbi:hypothetical protein [Thermosyntropha sp.]|uniref:hypothetical protein n=1 Tax=Thermosyntropha sp. TaxID=2740820 RepID=UPI0025E457A9|nr:hypothetical protein [Thermosyntropha sp.]MBO8158396.1 hypothetical protein [Thermosyntropha sp.]
MRKNEKAVLMIYCMKCGNNVNEYNWTLATAARFSTPDNKVSTLISLLKKIAQGEKFNIEDYWLICPRCNEKVKLAHVPVPPIEEINKYIEQVGEEYCQFKF